MHVLQEYQECSRQLVNKDKSCFAVVEKSTCRARARVSRLTGFNYMPFPLKYLGCPLFVGRVKRSYFQALVESVSIRIQAWSSKWLSYGGKVGSFKISVTIYTNSFVDGLASSQGGF